MVSTGVKRKRRDKGNLVAADVEEGRRQAEAEKKVLGTTVTPDVPDSALFVVDRKGNTNEQIQKYLEEQSLQQKRAAKRARRSAPKVRKSEAATITNGVDIKQGQLPGKKKKKLVAPVEKKILSKRRFDKPEGHVGNKSICVREARKHTDGKEDLWTSEISRLVRNEVGLNRQRLVEKMNTVQRTAASILHLSSGLSVNPTHKDHQDKLGESLAKIVQEDDLNRWDAQKMSFDPALLTESTEAEIADTGMKCDENDTSEDESEEEEGEVCHRGAPERKTKTQRHKETRKRIMTANIARKKAEARRTTDLENLQELTREAVKEADKLNGTAKQRRRKNAPRSVHRDGKPVLQRIAGQKVRTEFASEPVPFSDELAGNMRGIKMPVANPILRDRFLSFERRGLVEPPKVLPKELWRMEQAKRQDEQRDDRKRKGRGSRSNLTFWRNGKRIVQ